MLLVWNQFASNKWYSDGERCWYVITADLPLPYRLSCNCSIAYYPTLEAAQQAAQVWDRPDSAHLGGQLGVTTAV
jgi:hypothetical protein